MIADVRHLLLEIEAENEGLERELRSPSIARLTEYVIAHQSEDATLRSLGMVAERLHLGVGEMTGNEGILPRWQ
ncbi:MAG: hypothetical protein QHC89_13615 [Bosea sp. (in: a-proteobacteria)]|nr:hypothetical protein [Bosea sp. (in: a-proteobacteria)]